jgi:hypothetical protein
MGVKVMGSIRRALLAYASFTPWSN